jgi:hypothetical protein
MSEVKGRGNGASALHSRDLVAQRAGQTTRSKAMQEDDMKNLSRFTRWIGLARKLRGLVQVSTQTVVF